MVTLQVTRKGRPLPGRASAEAIGGGHVALNWRGRLRRGWHRVKLTMDHGWGDGVDIWGGGRITARQARRLLSARLLQAGEGTLDYIKRCRSFGRRRADCEVRYFEDFIDNARGFRDTCSRVSAVVLADSGVLHERGYRCGNKRRARFRAHPRWNPSLEGVLEAD